jgi:5-formyltetrahydrofolate cyclo-ligase
MDDVKEEKQVISNDIAKRIESFTADEISEKSRHIEARFFDFANFIESYVVLLYFNKSGEVDTRGVINHALALNKVVVLPGGDAGGKAPVLMKLNGAKSDIILDAEGQPAPNPAKCRAVPVESIELALIPGLVFDEKGARIGLGNGLYDKLIPQLPATTRKVSLAFEDQIIQQVPKDSIDRHVDIIITEKRIVYKI